MLAGARRDAALSPNYLGQTCYYCYYYYDYYRNIASACADVCAVVASNSAVSDPEDSRNYGRASIGVSVAGIIIAIIIIIIVVAVAVSAANEAAYTYSSSYYYSGTDYDYTDTDSGSDSGSDSYSYSSSCNYIVSGYCYEYAYYVGTSSYYAQYCDELYGYMYGGYCYFNY